MSSTRTVTSGSLRSGTITITVREIARKVKKGELEIPVSPLVFADVFSARYGAKEIPVDTAVSLRTSALPEIHKDPADRFILATALLNNCVVVTGDRHFPEYGVETIV